MQFYTKPEKEDFIEFGMAVATQKNKLFRKQPILRVCILLLLFCAAAALFLFLGRKEQGFLKTVAVVGTVASFVGAALALLLLLVWLTMHSVYSGMYKTNNKAAVITINEAGLTSALEDGGQTLYYGWDKVQRVLISEHLYIFVMANGVGVFFNRRFVQGQEEALMQLVRLYTPGKPILDLAA